jgi:hypothetical protein
VRESGIRGVWRKALRRIEAFSRTADFTKEGIKAATMSGIESSLVLERCVRGLARRGSI